MVADRDRGDPGPDLLDDAGSLMPEYGRESPRPLALHDMVVAVADAGGAEADAHLALAGIDEPELLELERTRAAVPHGRGDGRH